MGLIIPADGPEILDKAFKALGDREVPLGIFDRCTVEIGIEKDRNTKRGRTKMVLV